MLAGPSPAARGEVGWYRETSAKQNAANAGGRPLARNRPPSMRDGPTVAVYNFDHAKEQALEDLHRDRGVVRLPDGSGCVASVKRADAPLLTRWAKDVSPTNAHPEYPRPQLVRERWMNLNGLWN